MCVVPDVSTTCKTAFSVLVPPFHSGVGSYDPDDRQYKPRIYSHVIKLLGVKPTHDAAASDDGANSFCSS